MYLENLLQLLISEYRSANEQARRLPAPAYFAQPVSLCTIAVTPCPPMLATGGGDLAGALEHAHEVVHTTFRQTLHALDTVPATPPRRHAPATADYALET